MMNKSYIKHFNIISVRVIPHQACCSAFYCYGFVFPCFTIPDLLFHIPLFRVPSFRVLPQPFLLVIISVWYISVELPVYYRESLLQKKEGTTKSH